MRSISLNRYPSLSYILAMAAGTDSAATAMAIAKPAEAHPRLFGRPRGMTAGHRSLTADLSQARNAAKSVGKP
jgi:hypothetical protein